MNEQFVPKYYVMDPETEELVFDAMDLRNGMVVLIADPDERTRPELGNDRDWEMDRLLERNRWCTVSKIDVSPETNSVYFLATYEDGTQRKRQYSITQAWLAKKDSVESSNRRSEKVEQYIMAAVMDAIQVTISEGTSEDEKTTQLGEIVEKSSSWILDLF